VLVGTVANVGVTEPLVLIAALPYHVPPLGLTIILNGAILLQNGFTALIDGIIVFVTEIFNVVVDGQTVGFGLDVVM